MGVQVTAALKATLLFVVTLVLFTLAGGATAEEARMAGRTAAPAREESPLTDGQALEDAAALATHWGDFDAAQALFLSVRKAARRTTVGQPESTPMRLGFQRGLRPSSGLSVRQAEHTVALTARWVQQHPRSPLAHWAHVSSLQRLGWAYRGDGYANTVAPQSWVQFRSAINRAVTHATQHADVLLSDSMGAVVLLAIGGAADWEPRRLQALYDEVSARFPDDDSIHFVQLDNLLPKWGGSARAVDAHIESVVRRTQAQRGLALYAWLYTSAAQEQFKQALFSDSLARWPRMDQGFAYLTARFPHPRHFNAWAWISCQAEDRVRLLEVLGKIGPEPDLSQWGSNPRQTYETCRAWAQKL